VINLWAKSEVVDEYNPENKPVNKA